MGKSNILLVCDIPEYASELESYLRPLNENLIHVTAGRNAIEQVTAQDVAVIVLDVDTKNASVLELLDSVTQHETLHTTPMILLTPSDAEIQWIFNRYPIGVVDYLAKPIAPEQLQARLWPYIELFRKTQALRQDEIGSLSDAANQHLLFLNHASKLLSSTLDYDTTFNNLRELILPNLADIYSIDVLEEDKTLHRIAVVAAEPTVEAWVHELEGRTNPQSLLQLPMIASGKPMLFETIPQQMFESAARDAEHLALLKQINATSEIIVPLRIREALIGILTVVRRGARLGYGPDDVVLMEELANRIAQAIDNARLYREAAEQRERWQVTLTSIGDAVIATDQNGIITFMNPIAESLTGWAQADAMGKVLPEVFNIVNEITRQAVESPVDKVLRQGAIVGLANHSLLISKDGRETPIDDSGAPIRSYEGTVAGVILVFRDITERQEMEFQRTQVLAQEHQAHALIQAANQKLQFLAQVSTALVSSIDYEKTLVTLAHILVPQMADNCVIDLVTDASLVERVAVASTNPEREEALRELARRFPPDPLAISTRQSIAERTPRLVPQLTDAYYQAAAQNAEHLALMKASGGKSLLIVPLIIGERTLGAISLGMVDSGHFYDEEDLDLMTEIAHRAAFAVEHARLYREAQEEIRRRGHVEQALQVAIQSRDDFLSVASHELKTPVTSLRGFAQTLLRQLDKRKTLDMAQVERALYVIDQQATKLNVLVSQLLDMSRLEAGRLKLDPSEIDVPALTAEVIMNIQRGSQYPIRLEAPTTLLIWADPLRLEQVIVNLIDNAIKFSLNQEPVHVFISTPGSDTMQLSVQDHGIGVPIERREHLFERFYQAHEDGYHGGMGLGLYISRQIIELHGGKLSAEFPDEGGTRFVIVLPARFKNLI